MSLEITILDKGRVRADQPIGKVLIGPGQTESSGHWEEIQKEQGYMIRMSHAIKEA